MKKLVIFLLTILSAFTIYLSANARGLVEVDAAAPSGYYSGTEGLSGDSLLNKLATITQNNHKKYTSYDDIKKGNAISDRDPKNSSNLLDFYSKISVKAAWDGGNTWNREHVWPQSLSGGLYGTSGAGSDIHHIRPTISSINSSRGHKLFTDFDRISANGTAKNYNGTLVAYQNNEYWEPLDDVKGDTARIIMYMYMHYSKEVSANASYSKAGNLRITSVIYAGGGAEAAWDMLCDWNELDPVDSFEANRHDYCVEVTGTRNPFIDDPQFANRIWGDGEGGGSTPTPTTYSVTYNVNSKAVFSYTDNNKYSAGSKIKEPTVEPKLEGYTFEGWYKDSSYSTKWNFSTDTITANTTLYAKFVEVASNPTNFEDIFENLKVKSQLTFNVDTIMPDALEAVEKTCTINVFTAGDGTLSGTDFNLADYMEFDTNLFDIYYKKNNGNGAYISSSKNHIRLYPGAGNGSSIEITAKNGVMISDVSFELDTDSPVTPEVSISTDGLNATIQNTSSATSGNQARIKSISITYVIEMNGGEHYEVIDDSVCLSYVLQLNETAYSIYAQSDYEIEMYINNQLVEYEFYVLDGEYRLIYTILVEDFTTVYKPVFKFNDIEISLDGYSAQTLSAYYLNNLKSNQLVKEYSECLEEIRG